MGTTTTRTGGVGGRLVLSPATILAALVGILQVAQVSASSGSMLTLPKTKTLFAFGDSYSMTGFDPSLGYDPLAQNLTTSSGGNSWVGYLSQSPLADPALESNLFDFARGGATIAPNATFAGYPNMSMSNQVDIFEKWFTNNSEAFLADQEEQGGRPEWDADDSLFTVWFGINDLEIAFKRNESWVDVYGNSTFEFLDEQVARLYTLGARHFLFHLVPPFHLSPLVATHRANDSTAQTTFKDDVTLWNDSMRDYVGRVHEIYEGASAMAWETEEWFEVVLSAPGLFGFANSTGYCEAYARNAFQPDAPTNATELAACGAPESEFFWLDRSHPTFSVHELLATAVATTLSPGETVPVQQTAEQVAAEEAASPLTVDGETDVDSTTAAATDAVTPTSPHSIVPLVDPAALLLPASDSAPSAAAPIDPSIPSPVSIPVDVNAGVGYLTLENGDTLPTGTVWTRREKRAPGAAEQQAARDAAASAAAANRKSRDSWKTRSRTSGSSSRTATSSSARSTAAPAGIVAGPGLILEQPKQVLDPNVGVGYATLANGDTLPTGVTWAKAKRAPAPDAAAQQEAMAAAASSASAAKKQRQSWKTRVRPSAPLATPTAAIVPVPAPVVPVNPNVGAGFVTLANGDTLPTGVTCTKRAKRAAPPAPAVSPDAAAQDGYVGMPTWYTLPDGTIVDVDKRSLSDEVRNHLERREHGQRMRKITPTMVHVEKKRAAAAATQRTAVGKRAEESPSFWEGVKERTKESLLHPAGLGVAA
ncbi:hypothetical protein JCM6882_007391 [Rhodosporidiobolus microsporus]